MPMLKQIKVWYPFTCTSKRFSRKNITRGNENAAVIEPRETYPDDINTRTNIPKKKNKVKSSKSKKAG